MGIVHVSKLALRAASEQQVCDLWRGTSSSWWWWEDRSSRISVNKSDGEAGLVVDHLNKK